MALITSDFGWCRWLAAAQSNGALSALLAPAGVQVGGCVVLEMGAGIGLGGVWASALGIGRPENGVGPNHLGFVATAPISSWNDPNHLGLWLVQVVLTDLPAVLPNLRAVSVQ